MNRVLCLIAVLQFANASLFPICAMPDSESQEKMKMETRREWGKETEGQAISITTKKTAFLPGERIDLTISLKNVSTQDIRVVKTVPLAIYQIEVLAPNKGKAPLTMYGETRYDRSGTRSRSVSILKPGEEAVTDINLGRLFDFSLSGQYIVSVQRGVWGKGGDPKGATAVSNSITITIDEAVGSDPQR